MAVNRWFYVNAVDSLYIFFIDFECLFDIAIYTFEFLGKKDLIMHGFESVVHNCVTGVVQLHRQFR